MLLLVCLLLSLSAYAPCAAGFGLPSNLTASLGLPQHNVVVNSTQWGNVAGALLAGTFFTAAVVENFPGLFDLAASPFTQSRSDWVEELELEEGDACRCEDYCRNKYSPGHRKKRYCNNSTHQPPTEKYSTYSTVRVFAPPPLGSLRCYSSKEGLLLFPLTDSPLVFLLPPHPPVRCPPAVSSTRRAAAP